MMHRNGYPQWCSQRPHVDELIAVDIKVKILTRHFVVGAVFAQFTQRFIESRFQLRIIFAQANPGSVAKLFFIFN